MCNIEILHDCINQLLCAFTMYLQALPEYIYHHNISHCQVDLYIQYIIFFFRGYEILNQHIIILNICDIG